MTRDSFVADRRERRGSLGTVERTAAEARISAQRFQAMEEEREPEAFRGEQGRKLEG